MSASRLAPCLAAVALVATAPGSGARAAPAALIIEHVTVIPMTRDGRVLRDQNVIIVRGRISAIEPAAGKTGAVAGSRRVDGTGKFLMPSLTDAHVHLENDRLMRLYLHQPGIADGAVRSEDIFLPYVANGVLQVVDLSAMSETVGQRLDVESGRVLGPHVAMAAMIDGEPPGWPIGMTRVATTASDGRQAVRDAAAEGYELIKVYSSLDLATFTAIVDEARRLHLPVVGHIPQRGQGLTERFFQPGFGMVAHAEEFAQQTDPPADAKIPSYVEMAKRNGTWLTATLTLDERILEETEHPGTLNTRPELRYITPLFYPIVVDHNPYVARASEKQLDEMRRIVSFNAKLVRAFADAGIPVLTGTDTPVPGLVAGFALHDELEAMARAGLSPRQILEGSTRLPAEWLGVDADRGVVAVGKRADLLLLEEDPLRDVANTRQIAAVIDGGRYLARSQLDHAMCALADRYQNGATRAGAQPH